MLPRTAGVTCTDSSSAAMGRTLSASLVTPRGGDSAMVPTYSAPGQFMCVWMGSKYFDLVMATKFSVRSRQGFKNISKIYKSFYFYGVNS